MSSSEPDPRLTAACQRVLERVGTSADALVSASGGSSALTRFANSRIHQNVSEATSSVVLTVASGEGRSARAATTRADDDSLDALVERALAAARLAPPDPDFPGFAGAAEPPEVDHLDGTTAAAGPGERARIVADFVAAAGDMEAAGYCSTEADVAAVATTAGQRVCARTSMAQLDGIHRAAALGHPSDGYAQVTSTRIGDIDGAFAGTTAAAKARRGMDPIELDPGEYEVVLEAKAVAAALLFPAYLGFNGKAHAEGTSFVHLGEDQWDAAIDIWDDATDPRALGRPFDAEGTPKRRVELVSGGTSAGLVHDRRSARLAGVDPTGHSVGSTAFGGYPTDLFVGGGDRSLEELIAGVGRGLLVSDLWYNRILDPKTQVVTGLTRNGVFLIEHGEVSRPVENLRYTQSIVAAFGPGRVLGLGDDARLVPNEGAVVHVPSVRLASWSFTGNARR